MALADRIPGMKAGEQNRNVLVAMVWVLAIGTAFGMMGGGGSGGPPATPVATTTPTETATPAPTTTQVSPREQSVESVRGAAQNAQYVASIRSVSAAPDFQGRDGYMVELRYDLDTEGLGMMGSTADDAEHRGGTVARTVIEAAADQRPEGLVSLAVYAYVPTTDGGSSVSTKVVVDLERFEDVDWSAYPWQQLRDDANQYKFNRYLYE